MPRLSRFLAALALFLLGLSAQAQVYEGRTLVEASLKADTDAIVPGRPFRVGLLLQMAPGWHTYWQHPGDSGLATRIDWKLPEGFSASGVQWPLPHRMVEPGDIVTYGYGDEVMLLTTITPPSDISAKEITVSADVTWLVCEKICIPGSAPGLTLTLPVSSEADPANTALFERYRATVPSTDSPPFPTRWEQRPEEMLLTVNGLQDLPDSADVDFFPMPPEGVQLGHPVVSRDGGTAIIRIPMEARSGPASAAGVLAVGSEAWEISSLPAPQRARSAAEVPPPAVDGGLTVGRALLFGLVGGFILNLMPCVLPVIALKIFGFIKQAGESRARILRLGLAFVAGIFAWFLALALLIIGFRLAGRDLNWAFQFQNSGFVLGMSALLFVFALNLLGVFEIYLPGGASSRLVNLAAREGYGGAFLHGVFATLLATPCTAPFLGPALGFAFAQSALIVFAVFMAIAAGMSLPYLLLAIQPAWLRFLPRPGPWMERVKQAMGFLLLATVLFLLWVLGRQRGVDGLVWAAAFLLVLSIACWVFGTFMTPAAPRSTRWIAGVCALALVASGLFFLIGGKFASATPGTERSLSEPGAIPWRKFNPAALAEARSSGQPVFVDFTADWCVNCKWNERFVLETPPVAAAFQKAGVIPFKADWTNGDPAITALLRSFGRAGVPVYVLYPPDPAAAPVVLPEILTKDGLLQALGNLSPNTAGI